MDARSRREFAMEQMAKRFTVPQCEASPRNVALSRVFECLDAKIPEADHSGEKLGNLSKRNLSSRIRTMIVRLFDVNLPPAASVFSAHICPVCEKKSGARHFHFQRIARTARGKKHKKMIHYG